MAYTLKELYSPGLPQSSERPILDDKSVDIVAVHDLNHSVQDGWTEPRSGILWLRDLLPASIKTARILSFEFESSASLFFHSGCERAVRTHADNLLTSLQSDRELESCQRRPIIFLCHGMGGILVKQALIHSASQTSPKVEMYYSIFVSTYGILFFGTPHNCYNGNNWIDIENYRSDRKWRPKTKASPSNQDFDIVRSVNAHFSTLLKQYHVYFFWAELMTDFGNRLDHMVEDVSSAPIIDDTERAGIYNDHYSMVRYSRVSDSSYRAILAALLRYTRAAPSLILRRWEKATVYLRNLRSERAFELAGFDFNIHLEESFHQKPEPNDEMNNEFFMLPREAPTEFVGRGDIIHAIENGLFFATLDDQRQRILVIHGIGGCGKTRISCKFAWNHRQRYWGIFTVDATSMQTAKASFADLGRMGGLEPTESAGRHWLSSQKKPWLLIIDNADDPTLDVPKLFPKSNSGHILITTRNADLHRLSTGVSIELKGMKKKEALQLLLRRAEILAPWGKSTKELGYIIVEALGYLALALIQAGNCISRKLCELHNYLNFHELYRNRHQVQGAPRESTPDDELNVYPTFDFSLSSIETQNTTTARDALEILNIVAFYHFENIRVDIFTRASSNCFKSLQKSTRSSMTGWALSRIKILLQPPAMLPKFLKDECNLLDHFRLRRALYELYKLSFITYTTKGDSFSLHPLVHSWAKDRLSVGEKKLWAQLALNTLLASFALPPEDEDDSIGSFKRDLLPHLDSCLRICPVKIGYSTRPPTSFQLKCCKIFGWSLFLIMRSQIMAAAKCGYLYASRGRFADAAEHLTMAKDSLAQILGDENEKTMMAELGLANVFWGLGRLEEAISLQSRVVEARRKVCGPAHPDTLRAMDMLGKSHWLHGQYHEALSIQRQTTTHMKTALGSEHDDTLAALDNYGVTLGSWHRFQESRDVHAQVLAVRKKRLKPGHLDTLTTMNNLAMALLDLQELHESKELMFEVYEERQAQLGKEHPWTLWALCNLAKVKIELCELNEAEEMLVEGIAAGKRSLGDDHLGVLMGSGALALAYSRQGRLIESEELTLATIKILERSRGLAHPDTAFAIWKLAHLYEKDQKRNEAIKTYQIARKRISMRLGKSHPLYAQVIEKLESIQNESEQILINA